MLKTPLLVCAAITLAACGGGGQDEPEVGIPTPQPTPLALSPANYGAATATTVGKSSIAFDAARLAGETVVVMLDRQVNLIPNWPCPSGGTVSFELTDRNNNGWFNEDDTLHLRLDRCVTNGVTVHGLMRMELQTLTTHPDGHDYAMTFEMVDLAITAGTTPTRRFNFSGTLNLSRGANHEAWVLSFGNLRLQEGNDTLTVINLLIDYSQRYDLGTFGYLVQGDFQDSRLGGVFRVTTPDSFTGTIGQFPTEGRLLLAGANNSAARVSEEGAAASDAERVQVSVDSNGDNADDQQAGVLWSDLTYNLFGSLRDAADATLLPVR